MSGKTRKIPAAGKGTGTGPFDPGALPPEPMQDTRAPNRAAPAPQGPLPEAEIERLKERAASTPAPHRVSAQPDPGARKPRR